MSGRPHTPTEPKASKPKKSTGTGSSNKKTPAKAKSMSGPHSPTDPLARMPQASASSKPVKQPLPLLLPKDTRAQNVLSLSKYG